jgi:expansin (peptidoglycan-binding protein)
MTVLSNVHPSPRSPRRHRSSLLSVGVMTALWVGCGAAEEGDDGGVPGFSGNAPGVGGTGAVAPGAAGTTSTAPVNTPEGQNPNTPIQQPSQMPVGSACTPNSSSCAGNTLARCDGAGQQLAPQDCAATGGTCAVTGGVAACVAPTCTPGAITCATANEISTCAADGSGATLSRCPNGTNCTGAGTCEPVACNQAAMLSSNNGGVTVYWFNQGTYSNPRQADEDVNCSFGSDGSAQGTGQQDRVFNIPDETMFGAINGNDYANAGACGACVELRNPNGNRSVTITVVDSCLTGNNNPTCTAGHIDLSRAAFEQLTGQNTGDINGISWNFVPCPGEAGVQFQLKEPTNQYWNQFLVVGHRYPIAKAEVEMEPGRWVEARRETYNYFFPPEGNAGEGGDMGTYRVRVTDVNGAIVEEQLELREGLQGGSGQFGCQ